MHITMNNINIHRPLETFNAYNVLNGIARVNARRGAYNFVRKGGICEPFYRNRSL